MAHAGESHGDYRPCPPNLRPYPKNRSDYLVRFARYTGSCKRRGFATVTRHCNDPRESTMNEHWNTPADTGPAGGCASCATVDVRGVRIGAGVPKTIVALMGADAKTCLEQADAAVRAGADMLEWRMDFAANVHDTEGLLQTARALRAALPDTPLLGTFRSGHEGGCVDLPIDQYASLVRAIAASGNVDLVDIELWIGDDAAEDLARFAHEHGVVVVMSHHDFEHTPDIECMRELLVRMAGLGADIPKLAVMARSAEDALRLLQATVLAGKEIDTPLVTMAMGAEGAITRLVGEVFESSATFCALNDASAPGQVDLALAQRIMENLHDAIG